MQTIRTTFNIQADTHRYLSALAKQKNLSMGEVIDKYFSNKNVFLADSEQNQKINRLLLARKKIAKVGESKVRLADALRSDRDRDNE